MARPRHGATPRQPRGAAHDRFGALFDRWLDLVVIVAVLTALIVGFSAVLAHWLLT
ncbi:hypothetical protein ACGK9R_02210 [Halomonas sp. HNIBRBA4712]|uniref:hypothetical protein n=1 Tax=Halomonas sp. HNIBRBA4712 TaxID=3373087 RepID=UPI0037472CF7